MTIAGVASNLEQAQTRAFPCASSHSPGKIAFRVPKAVNQRRFYRWVPAVRQERSTMYRLLTEPMLHNRWFLPGRRPTRRSPLSLGSVRRVACPHDRPLLALFMAQDAPYQRRLQ